MIEKTKADEKVYSLSRPFVFEDKTYNEIILDFDKLTGDDLITAERRFAADSVGQPSTFVKEVSKGYLTYIVAAAASVPAEFIKKLPAKDFASVTLSAQSFLLL